jgi:hypothetical protein
VLLLRLVTPIPSFTVEGIGFESKRDAQDQLINTITLTLVPGDRSGTKFAERPLGTEVARVIKSGEGS